MILELVFTKIFAVPITQHGESRVRLQWNENKFDNTLRRKLLNYLRTVFYQVMGTQAL